jgi:hypothetical protein
MRGQKRGFRRVPVFAALLAVALGGCECGDILQEIDAAMIVTPKEVKENRVAVAQDTEIEIKVSNPSGTPLRITNIALVDNPDPAFRLQKELPDGVVAGGEERFLVIVRPQTVSTIKATLRIEGDSNRTPRVDVPLVIESADLGLPDIEVDPLEVDFDRIGEGDVVRAQVNISNVGIRDLIIDSTTLMPLVEGDASIRIVTPLPPGWLLQPNETVTVELVFAPEDTALHEATLLIGNSDPDESLVEVPVRGQGHTCPTAVAQILEDPEDLEPLDTIRLDASESYTDAEDTTIAAWEWRLSQRPVGSTAVIENADLERGLITCDIAGDYEIALTVYDDTGVRSCSDGIVRFTCVPTEELHIQLVWDHPDADLDLHLIRGNGEPFNHTFDTYFSNREPDWFPDNPESNPSLDVDDNRGYGPENVNIETPLPGSEWRVFVHYWNKQTDGDAFTLATLRIYAKGQLQGEFAQAFDTDELMWQAVQIEWPNDEASLPTVNPLGIVEPFARPF